LKTKKFENINMIKMDSKRMDSKSKEMLQYSLMKSELLNLIKEKSLKKGEVVLSSGKKSSYYIDLRTVTLHPKGAYLIGKIFIEKLKKEKFDSLGGLTLGADPICGAVAALSYVEGCPIKTFIVRKEEKKHGMQKLIEGNIESNSSVVIVEDVITTGSSVLKAIAAVEDLGCRVVKVLAVVDRLEEKKEYLKKYNVEAIFTIKEILKKI